MLTALSLLALLAAPADAADNELSFELGSIGTMDDRFDLFHDRELFGTMGVRGAVAVHDRVNIVASWQHAGTGNQVEVEGESSDDEYSYQTFQAAYHGHHVTLGPKADVELWDWAFPYVTVQGAMFFGRVLLDDDPEHDDNPGQLKASAVSPGGVAALGMDIVPVKTRGGAVGFGSHVELGYGLTAASSYKAKPASGNGERAEIARFGFGGFYLRAGVGLYF